MMRRSWGVLLLAWALAAGAQPGPSVVADPVPGWQAELARMRELAENDAPLAHEQAQRWWAALPTSAPPTVRVKALNLLAHTEIYLAQASAAERHAQQALDMAAEQQDREGQVEADLNIVYTAINEGRVDLMVSATTHALKMLDGLDRPALVGEALLWASTMQRRVGRPEESIATAMRGMEIAKGSQQPLALSFALQGLALSFGQSGHPDEALAQYAQMREQAQAAHSKMLEAEALLGLASANTDLGRLDDAQAGLQEASMLLRKVGSPWALGRSRFGLADLATRRGQFGLALVALEEVRALYQTHPNPIGQWHVLTALCTNHQALSHGVAASEAAEQAYALAKRMGVASYIAKSARQVAGLAATKGDHRRAYALLAEAEAVQDKAARASAGTEVIELSQRYEAQSKQRQIVALTHRNEQQATALQRRELQQAWLWSVVVVVVLALAVAIYLVRLLRRSQRALEQQTDVLQSILDSMGDGVLVANVRNELLLMNPAARHMLGQTPEMGAVLRGHHCDLRLPDQITPCPPEELPLARAVRGEFCDELELYSNLQARWFSATARPLTDRGGVVHGGVVVVSDVTARKQAELEIRRLNEQRRELEFRREAAREEERRHIARELHDELGQFLSALRMELALLRMRRGGVDEELREKTQSLQGLVDHVIGVVRNLVSSLRPAVLDMGIAAALEWLGAEFSASSGLRCDLQIDEEAVQLDTHQSSMVFRIVQESLTNVARHAQAQGVQVSLQRVGEALCLVVRDDGGGFDPAQVGPKSFGLLGLRERAQMLGGQLTVSSQPDLGTTITVSFPLVTVAGG